MLQGNVDDKGIVYVHNICKEVISYRRQTKLRVD
jgi:hypothetical protein